MKWIVLGAGRSGLGAKKLLEHHKQSVVLFDENKSKLSTSLTKELIDNVDDPIFMEAGLRLVISPGFSLDHPVLKRARERKQSILSEIDLALTYYHGKVIAVTGTNGKSTTVMMIAHLLKALNFDFAIGGNIGIAATTVLLDRTPEYLVLELSSYQIEASHRLKPTVAVLTGIAPDHLQRHKTLKGYTAAKWSLFEKQTVEDLALIESSIFEEAVEIFTLPRPKAKILLINKDQAENEKSLSFRWKHDRLNALFSLNVVSFLSKKPLEELSPLLKSYKGLPFRCEIIGEWGQWSIINDSKGTNIDSTLHALTNTKGKITLFIGGLSKGESFQDLLKFKDKIGTLVAFGQGRHQAMKDLGEFFPTRTYITLAEAMNDIDSILTHTEGDLLFSPACASQDEFIDFEDRGRFFTLCVHKALKNNQNGRTYEPLFKTQES